LVACIAGSALSEESLNVKWANYKEKYNKTYSPREDHFRKMHFVEALDQLAELNENRGSAQFALNKFADYSKTEKDQMLGVKLSKEYINELRSKAPKYDSKSSIRASPVDWRQKGAVLTTVKDQKTCGSCWAFACASALESTHAIKTGNLVSLSEQDFLDCSGAGSCDGGDPFAAYNNMAQAGKGIDLEECYPYKNGQGACLEDSSCTVAFPTGIEVQANEAQMEDYVANTGPTVGLVAVDDQTGWMYYSNGLFEGPCGNDINHGITIVGFTDSAWIIRNSWGGDWGDDGYMLMAKGKNTCQIETVAVAPTV